MISAIILSGGKGKRFGGATHKQYKSLGNKLIVHYSYELFIELEQVDEVIVVCEKEFEHLFSHPKTLFATPGKRRQDSVYNGLQVANGEYLAIHDACYPFVLPSELLNTIQGSVLFGAACLGVPLRHTIKEKNTSNIVVGTPERSRFWEIQTPQVIRKPLLTKGFQKAKKNNVTVTDDTSLMELIEHPVKLIKGSYRNIKITVPEDFLFAEALLPEYKQSLAYERTLQV